MLDRIITRVNKYCFNTVKQIHLIRYSYIQKQLVGDICFQCNICGESVSAKLVDVCDRDKESCPSCGSNLRYRSIIHILSEELFGESIVLPDFPVRDDIKGLGMSDWHGYSDLLATKTSYTNTFYHKEPKLDITHTSEAVTSSYDFVISSDVFEHIATPVSIGFHNMRGMLRDNGLCILTVPFMHYPSTLEHFPGVDKFEIGKCVDGTPFLKSLTESGRQQVYNHLVFHGGDGATLEMRIFSKSSLRRELERAGFKDVKFHTLNQQKYGIIWPISWSLPITARRSI